MLRYCLYRLIKGGRLGYWFVPVLLILLSPTVPVHAHGGTLIASGTSPNGRYGWMLSASPTPLVTGPVSLSLLVFDTRSSAIVNTVAGELYIAAPTSPRPCCEPGVHQGPFPLLLEPFQYGDYIAYVPVDQLGPWEVQFRLTVADDSLTLVAPFEVVGEGALDQAAIQTAVDELTQTTRQQALAVEQAASPLALATATLREVVQAPGSLLSPLATPILPLATALPATLHPPTNAINPSWLVGSGVGAIIVGAGLFWWRIRKKS